MQNRNLCLLFLSCLIVGTSIGCGDIRPLWKGSIELKDYTMYYSEPCEYQVNLKHIGRPTPAMLELVITYYVGTTRNSLPLFVVLEDQNHKLSEFTTLVVLKAEGEWMGIPEENEIDYTLTHIAIPELILNPEEYTLRIYANDEEIESLYGVVNISARFYETPTREN